MMICPFEKLDKEIASTFVFRRFSSIYKHFFPRFNRRKVFDSIKFKLRVMQKDFLA